MKTREIPLDCVLTQEERLERGKELAAYGGKVDELKDEKKVAGSEYTQAIKNTEAKVRELRRAVKDGEEERMVPCEFQPDTEKWEIVTVRLDTNEEVDRRAMSPGEREANSQGQLFDEDGNAINAEDVEAEEAKADQDELDGELAIDKSNRKPVTKGDDLLGEVENLTTGVWLAWVDDGLLGSDDDDEWFRTSAVKEALEDPAAMNVAFKTKKAAMAAITEWTASEAEAEASEEVEGAGEGPEVEPAQAGAH